MMQIRWKHTREIFFEWTSHLPGFGTCFFGDSGDAWAAGKKVYVPQTPLRQWFQTPASPYTLQHLSRCSHSRCLVLPLGCHPFTVKKGFVNGLISSVQKRLCYHLARSAMRRQVARFKSAGYSDRFIFVVLEKGFWKKENTSLRSKARRGKT